MGMKFDEFDKSAEFKRATYTTEASKHEPEPYSFIFELAC